MAKNKIDREQVVKNIIKSNIKSPTDDLVHNIADSIYNTDNQNYDEARDDMDSFKASLSSMLKNVEGSMNNDIVGSLYKYTKKSGNIAGAQQLASLLNGFDDDQQLNNSLLSVAYLSYSNNIQKYRDIRMVVKMIPQFQEAIESMTDAIIASDNFNNLVSFNAEQDIMDRAKILDQKYNLFEKLRRSIYDSLQYGYAYTAVIPYKKAFKRFKLNNLEYKKAYLANQNKANLSESLDILLESSDVSKSNIDNIKSNLNIFLENITISNDSMALLESADIISLQEVTKARSKKAERQLKLNRKEKPVKNTAKLTVDGLINTSNKINLDDDDVTGCIVKNLEIEKIIPIKIDDTILGYYYIEDTGILNSLQATTNDPAMTINNIHAAADRSTEFERANGQVFQQMSDIIVDAIIKDKDFLKNNSSLKEQIYAILRYGNMLDKSLKITYLPADQVIEFGEGDSMIERSLFYAKLYLALLITNIMIKITRGYDKRIYTVKSAVPADIANSTYSAIREIKKDQRSISMISDTNKILNTAGKAPDIFIPVDNNGNKAIDYDVMAGQDVQIKDELLEFLEDRMLAGTGTPTPLIQATTDVDFAKTLQMLNTKFLRRSLSNQRILNPPTNELFNSVNAADQGLSIEDDNYEVISVEFLPPSALGINAMNEQVGNAKDLVDIIVRTFTDSGIYSDEVTGEFTKVLMKELCTLLPWAKYEDLLKVCIEQTSILKKKYPKNDSDM